MRSRIQTAFSILAVLAGPAIARAAQAELPAKASYERALRESRGSKLPNLEKLFALAVAAGKEIHAENTRADEARFHGRPANPAITSLEGLIISTDEALIAQPDPIYFASLAEEKGRPVDRDFFRLLVATKPDGVWAIYWQQQTDVTGCLLFDLPELPSLYAGWLEFRARFPAAYGAQVRNELNALDEALLSTCACGTDASVVAGLEAVANAARSEAIAAKLRKRLGEVRRGTSKIRFECKSG